MTAQAVAPYESPLLRQVLGPALRPGGLDLTRRALDRCGFGPGDRVADLGCGLGSSAGHLTQAQGLRVLGLDLSAEMLSAARRSHPRLTLIRARAEAIPLEDSSLEGVLCECVLSLTQSPRAVLEECRRVLRPGGRLAVSDLYLRNPPPKGREPSLPGCLGGALGRDGVAALAVEAGLEVVLWEDHSLLLRHLAARLAWAQGSLEALWGDCGGRGCREAADRAARARPGYFLMLAQRKAEFSG